jgi:hypothetical protein
MMLNKSQTLFNERLANGLRIKGKDEAANAVQNASRPASTLDGEKQSHR